MKIIVKVCKEKGKDTFIMEKDYDVFDGNDFETELKSKYSTIEESITPIKDEDIFVVKTDLHIDDDILLGGCSITGTTINAMKVNILDMCAKQLTRQIKETLEKRKQK